MKLFALAVLVEDLNAFIVSFAAYVSNDAYNKVCQLVLENMLKYSFKCM